jgi:hypothetical protein
MNNFLIYGSQNFHIQNKQYFIFVMKRGIETFSHVFKILLLYTKNLELTSYHCKKAFFYYIEFIGQIGDDTHTYLQLNSKDAALFVYKKTIFDIDNDYKKNFHISKEEENIIRLVSLSIEFYNNYVLFFMNENHGMLDISKDKEFIFCDITHSLKIIFDKLLKKNDDIPRIFNNIENSIYFFNILKSKGVEISKFKFLIDKFVKKIIKKNITSEKIREKMLSKNIFIYLKHYSSLKMINWVFA